MSFRAAAPDRVSSLGYVTGLAGDTALIGIDYRVQDGLLYGVGNAGGVYTLDTSSAVATKVPSSASPFRVPPSESTSTRPPTGCG